MSLYRDEARNLTAAKIADLPVDERRALRESVAFVMCDSIDSQEAALEDGTVDVVISPLTITSDRMQSYDFTQQYLSSGIALALPASSAIDFGQATEVIFETLFQPTVAQAIVLFLIFNLIMAFLIRRLILSDEDLGQYGLRPFLEAVIRTVGLKGVGDGYPSVFAKLLEVFMAIVGTTLSATILGILTSAFVGAIGGQGEVAPSALTSMHVATLKCSTSQGYLKEQYQALKTEIGASEEASVLEARIDALNCVDDTLFIDAAALSAVDNTVKGRVTLTSSWAEAVRLLSKGDVDAVLGDWIALTYASRTDRYKGVFDVQEQVYRNEPYGWAVARHQGSDDLRRSIDGALIAMMRDVSWRPRLERYLGVGSVSPN